ncbi:MAG: helix-turn-helix transcriptional regulator [Clostridia bacterium]|nr:helix-turn-helix transcriptional regulator [Clostridia bacterium]
MDEQLKRQPVFEKKSIRNGIEMPIQCLLRNTNHNDLNRTKWHPHYHDYIEFLFGLDSCEVNAWIAGETVRFGAGDLLVINASVAHHCVHLTEQTGYFCFKVLPEVLCFYEDPIFDKKYVEPFLRQDLFPYHLYTESELSGSGLSSVFTEMKKCWDEQEFGYEIALKSNLLQAFLWIIRTNRKKGIFPIATASDISDENILLIQRSIEFLHQNLSDVTEADAAAHANMSYSYYSKLFRRVVGKNFNEYLTAVRINEAERMLLSGDRPITEIALATGFASSSHFIDKFKKFRKKTPKQYRMQAQK